MTAVLAALAPVFALVVLGAVLKAVAVRDEAPWIALERFTYYLFLPALLAVRLGTADLARYAVWPMALSMMAAVVALVAALLALRPALGLAPGPFGSVVQGAIRQNSYIGLAAAGGLFGPDGVALAAVGIAAVIPLVNIVSVVLLLRLAGGPPASLGTIVGSLARNPLILGCAVGIAANAGGLAIPAPVAALLELLGRASLPLGLLVVGAGLDLLALRRGAGAVALSGAAKLALLPAATWLACRLLEADPTATAIAVFFNALPTSASSYVLARQMGGDHQLMAGILTAQVAAAAVTLPVVLTLVVPS